MGKQADLDALRNDALVAWLQPGADDAGLRRFIAGLEPARRAEVEYAPRAAREALMDFLSAPFSGDEDEWLFTAAIRHHLVGRFQWLSEAGVNALLAHIDSASAWAIDRP